MTEKSGVGLSGDRDIYVVSSVNHGEQEGVVAVFDMRGLAENFAEHASKPPGSKYYVTTWRLNVTDWTPPEWRP